MKESAAREEPLLGKVLAGKYLIREHIARGAMGVVYKAEQQPIGRQVAVKVLYPSASIFSGDPQFERRFLREAATYGRLKHPNTVTLYDYGQHTQGDLRLFYMAMEYVDGRPLVQVLHEQGALGFERAVHLAIEITRSLKEAHDLGIVHRDLKPSNVMLVATDDGETVKVLDFGIAKVLEDETDEGALTRTDAILGSPRYMSPEQVSSRAIDPRSDIYSLGVLLFEMLAGATPFHGRKPLDTLMMHLNDPVPTIAERSQGRARVPAEVEAVVRRCLEKDPAHRYQDIRELRAALRAARASGAASREDTTASVSPLPGPRKGVVGSPRSRRLGAGLLVALLAVLTVAALGWYRSSGRASEPPEPPPASAEPVEAAAPAPPPTPIRLAIRSTPPGAAVWEGTRLHGTTPLELESARNADRSFVLRLDGYRELALRSDGSDGQLDLVGALEPLPRPPSKEPEPRPPPEPRGDLKKSR